MNRRRTIAYQSGKGMSLQSGSNCSGLQTFALGPVKMREAAFGRGLGEQQGCSLSYWGYLVPQHVCPRTEAEAVPWASGAARQCALSLLLFAEGWILCPFPMGSKGFVPSFLLSPCLPSFHPSPCLHSFPMPSFLPKALHKSRPSLCGMGLHLPNSSLLPWWCLLVAVPSFSMALLLPAAGLQELGAAVTPAVLPGLIPARAALGGLGAACLCPEHLM